MTSYVIFGMHDNKDTNTLIDPWSLVHLYSGFYFMIWFEKILNISIADSILLSNLVHFLYELKDWYITYNTDLPDKDPKYYNSFLNSVGDQIFCNIGIIIYLFYKNKINGDKSNIFLLYSCLYLILIILVIIVRKYLL